MNDAPSTTRDLVEVIHTDTEFEAHTKAAVLHDQDIEARVIHAGATWAGMIPMGATESGAGVWVRQDDLAEAKAALQQNVADSVDLDWDEVNVGVREDDDQATNRQRMPIPARIAFVVAVLMMLLTLVSMFVMRIT